MQPNTLIPNAQNPQSWNRFSYVKNNPINLNDPTGHYECDDTYGCTGPSDAYDGDDGREDEDTPGILVTAEGYRRDNWWEDKHFKVSNDYSYALHVRSSYSSGREMAVMIFLMKLCA